MAQHVSDARARPCAGHSCDHCYTCRQGECCKRDRPDYRLPALGDWDGPIYGRLGALLSFGDKVECHCCGAWFGNLGSHVAARHGMTADEYRAIFGLRQGTTLIGPQMRRRKQQHNGHLARVRPPSPFKGLTWAQRSAYHKGRKQRLEVLIDPTNRRQWLRLARIGQASYMQHYRAGTLKPRSTGPKNLEQRTAGYRAFLADQERYTAWCAKIAENHGRKKLSVEKVRTIKRERADGQASALSLARRYQVSVSTIYDVLEGRTWAYVQ
jgi:ROS/MUCR transcriptional regulator protein